MQDLAEGTTTTRLPDPGPAAALPGFLAFLACTALLTLAVCGSGSGMPPGARVLTLAVAALLCASLFAVAQARPLAAARWAFGAALSIGGAGALLSQPATGLAVGLMLLPMILILQSLLALGTPRALLLGGLILALAAPVWLGPLAELAGSESGLPAWIMGLCPLSHLAAAAGCDYLHGDWFYAHSPLAGLQMITVPLTPAIVCYVAAATALLSFNVKSPASAGASGVGAIKRLQEPIR